MSCALNRTLDETLELHNENPELLLEWILLVTLPPEVTFDGLRYTFTSKNESHALSLLCTFWYLNGAQSRGAALCFKASLTDKGLSAHYEYTTESEYSSYDRLWKELYLFSTNESNNWSWSHSGVREFPLKIDT